MNKLKFNTMFPLFSNKVTILPETKTHGCFSKIYKLILPVLASIIFLSCQDKDIVSKQEKLKPFSCIYVDDVMELQLVEGVTHELEWSSTTKNVNQLSYHYIGDTIVLYRDGYKLRQGNKEKLNVKITSPNFRRIDIMEPCKVFCIDTLFSPNIWVTIQGAYADVELTVDNNEIAFYNNYTSMGKLKLSGKTQHVFLLSSFTLPIDAQNLVAQTGNVTNNSVSDIHLQIVQEMNLDIKSLGKVYCYGEPTIIHQSATSEGNLYIIEKK